MSRRRKRIRTILAGILLVAAGVGAYILFALNQVQPFYADAIAADPQELKSAGRRLEQRVEQLAEETAEIGHWETVFTEDEVNGWLAFYVQGNRQQFLPPQVVDPRIALVDGGCKFGFRYLGNRLDAVVSVEADAYMIANDVAAVRLRKAHLGMLPLAMSEVVEQISKGAARLGLPIRWTSDQDDPVLLVAVADALSTEEECRRLETLELREGEVLLAGQTEPKSASRAVTPVHSAAGR